MRATEMYQRAAVADVAAIVSLMSRYYADEGYAFDAERAQAAVRGLIDEPQFGLLWIAYINDEPAGYVVLTLGYSIEYGGRDAFIDDLYIAPAYRGVGLGSAGLALAEAACQELGVHALHLEVEQYKDRAQALYGRRGFVDSGRQLMTKRFDTPKSVHEE